MSSCGQHCDRNGTCPVADATPPANIINLGGFLSENPPSAPVSRSKQTNRWSTQLVGSKGSRMKRRPTPQSLARKKFGLRDTWASKSTRQPHFCETSGRALVHKREPEGLVCCIFVGRVRENDNKSPKAILMWAGWIQVEWNAKRKRTIWKWKDFAKKKEEMEGRATPTVLQIDLIFLFFAKTFKISYPTVWQLGLVL